MSVTGECIVKLLIIGILLFTTSCNNNLITPLDGSLVINLPSARSVSENVKEYKVDISGLQGEKQSQTAKVGGSIVFNDVAPDTYTVTVEGLDENSKVILRGEGTTIVNPGESAGVSIDLKGTSVLITFHSDDDAEQKYSEEVIYGEKLPANKFSEEVGSKEFIYWSTEQNGQGDRYENEAISYFTEPISLYAHWGIKHTITFHSNYGDNSETTTQTVEDNVETTLTKNTFKREGYTFTGWDGNSDGNSGTTYDDEGKITTDVDLNLYAQWTANKYTVTFHANYGASTETTRQEFTYGTEESLDENTFTREGYTFAGWNTESDGGEAGTLYTNKQSVNNLTSEPNGTVNLYAQWEPNKYTVTFHANYEGVSSENPTQTFIHGQSQALTENPLSRDGYTLTGWNTNPSGTGTAYSVGQSISISENLDLYAQWAVSSFEALQTEVSKGGEVRIIGDISVTEGLTVRNTVTLVGVGEGATIINASEAPLFTIQADSTGASSGNLTLGDEVNSLTLNGNQKEYFVVEVDGGELVMKDLVTIQNAADSGVKVSAGTFTMDGGEILNNSIATGSSVFESRGGGVYIADSSGNFIMNGGTITGNTAHGGGGVSMFGGTFTMNGGSIIDNTSSLAGGGVFVSGGTFTMYDGLIKRNTTTSAAGGGVSVGGGTFTMNGGSVEGNTAPTAFGDGIYVGGGTFEMKGSATVADDNEVCLADTMITITGELSGNSPVATITFLTYTVGAPILSGDAVSSEYSKFAVSPQKNDDGSTTEYTIDSEGKLQVK